MYYVNVYCFFLLADAYQRQSVFNRPVQGVVLRQMDTEPSRVVIPHRTTKDLERQLQVCDFILDPVYDPSVALYQSTFTMRVCEHET